MTRVPRILLVDDEANLRRVVAAGLGHLGFDVDVAEHGEDALVRLAARRPDAIVLDVNLPGMDGFETVTAIRRRSDAPIVMLTARAETEDKVTALACGADDYMSKPFDMAELAARLTAHLRRRIVAEDQLVYRDVVVDPARRSARRGTLDLMLSPREFDLLALFVADQGHVFRKSQLADRLWGPHADIGIETVDRFVSLLRQKLEFAGASRLIHTVRGVGYVLRDALPSGDVP